MKNWGTIHGGKSELTQPGANGTGNAIKFTASGKYHSVAFDLGPAIINDEAAGYKGAGATKYTLTFYAKGEKAGKFALYLNSQFHISDAGIKEINPALSCGKDTYLQIQSAPVEFSTEWQKYTVEFTIAQEWLDTLKGLKASTHKDAAKAYQLALRFDGSTLAYKDSEFFGYMIDEVTITAETANNGDGGSTEVKVPTGITIQAKEDVEASTWYKTKTGAVSAADIKNGEITKTIKVTNNGEETIRVCLTLQATVEVDGTKKWAGQNAGEYVEIEPGKTAELTFTMEVNDDKTVSIGDSEVALKEFFYRFDVKGEDGTALPKGTKLTIHGAGELYTLLSKLATSNSAVWGVETSYATSGSTGTGDVLPVALIATLTVATVALVVVVAKKRKEN